MHGREVLVVKLKEIDHQKDFGMDSRITLNRIFKKNWTGRCGLD
jgi:hypothetical protein